MTNLNLDTDIISQNQNKVFQMRKNCTDSELYYTLLTAWLIGEGKDVKDLAEQLSKNFPDFKQVIKYCVLLGILNQ